MIWYIWKERNRRIFIDEALVNNRLIERLKEAIIEVANNRTRLSAHSKFTKWDEEIQKEWNKLKRPKVCVPVVVKVDRKTVY